MEWAEIWGELADRSELTYTELSELYTEQARKYRAWARERANSASYEAERAKRAAVLAEEYDESPDPVVCKFLTSRYGQISDCGFSYLDAEYGNCEYDNEEEHWVCYESFTRMMRNSRQEANNQRRLAESYTRQAEEYEAWTREVEANFKESASSRKAWGHAYTEQAEAYTALAEAYTALAEESAELTQISILLVAEAYTTLSKSYSEWAGESAEFAALAEAYTALADKSVVLAEASFALTEK